MVFKLKTTTKEWALRLRIPDSKEYEIVLTDDKALMEEGKVNVVFGPQQVHQVEALLPLLYQQQAVYLTGFNERGQTRVESADVYFIESVGDEVVVATKNTTLQAHERLYQIEALLAQKDFVRVSKSMILNLAKVTYIQPALHAKLRCELVDGRTVTVNRGYVKSFKHAMKI